MIMIAMVVITSSATSEIPCGKGGEEAPLFMTIVNYRSRRCRYEREKKKNECRSRR